MGLRHDEPQLSTYRRTGYTKAIVDAVVRPIKRAIR